MTEPTPEAEPDYQATLEDLIDKNRGLIITAESKGIRPEMMFVMAGIEALKRAIAGNQEAFLALNILHEELFGAQLEQALQPKLITPS